MSDWGNLNRDILLNIFAFIPISNLLSSFLVCKNWGEMSSFEPLFQQLYQRGLKLELEKMEKEYQELEKQKNFKGRKTIPKFRRNFLKNYVPKLRKDIHFSQKFIRKEGYWKNTFIKFLKYSTTNQAEYDIKQILNSHIPFMEKVQLIKHYMKPLKKSPILYLNRFNGQTIAHVMIELSKKGNFDVSDLLLHFHDEYGIRFTLASGLKFSIFDAIIQTGDLNFVKKTFPKFLEDVKLLKKEDLSLETNPIQAACTLPPGYQENQLEILKVLLESELDKNLLNLKYNNRTPLDNALFYQCKKKVIDYLLMKGAIINTNTLQVYINGRIYVPLSQPIEDEMEILNLLLKHNFVIKTRGDYEDSILHKIAYSPNGELFYKLVEIFATKENINSRNYYNQTPLIICSQNERGSKVLEALLKCGADPNLSDDQCSPLCYAIMSNVENVEILLKYGARVNDLEPDGSTNLENAIFGYVANPKVVEGADPNLRNSNGETILTIHNTLKMNSPFPNYEKLFKNYKLIE